MGNSIRDWEQKVNWAKLEIGLNKYLHIMERFRTIEKLTDDFLFQTKFKGFYRVRRNDNFCKIYFQFMEDNKENKVVTFEDTLQYLYSNLNRVEASFSSKLVATINPELPVWDKEVLNNIEPEMSPYHSKFKDVDKIKLSIYKYEAMKEWYNETLNSLTGKDYIEKFDLRYPNSNITDLKKIDLILWQTRVEK